MPMKTKEEQREYQRLWMLARRDEWIRENGPCAYCETWKSLTVDHIDNTIKLFRVSSLWSLSRTNPKRVSELAKCQVLCNDCHKNKTNLDLNRGNPEHGTTTKYALGCKCVDCRRAKSLEKQEWRMLTGKN